MTTEILSTEKIQEIDWSVPQWVVSETGIIVYTNGKNDGNIFEGSLMPNICYPKGLFCTILAKNMFKLIPEEGLVVKLKN